MVRPKTSNSTEIVRSGVKKPRFGAVFFRPGPAHTPPPPPLAASILIEGGISTGFVGNLHLHALSAKIEARST
jgi:hypothetical protein